ncbi:MAG TPA: VOC family protein [Candidatus Methylomirabilis sp.]|nr:VOC family protein [Candidatus Methylomirabilis sp.]
MAELAAVRCVLAVQDLSTSVAFYRDRLGFALEFEVPGWAFLSRDRFQVMLGECPDAMPASQTGDHSYFAYVHVDDVDDLYRELARKGVTRVRAIADQPWGMREFGVRTPDGHRIMFGQRIAG